MIVFVRDEYYYFFTLQIFSRSGLFSSVCILFEMKNNNIKEIIYKNVLIFIDF